MLKKFDLGIMVAGGIAGGTVAKYATKHIDENEESKVMRIFDKIGVYAGCLVVGGLIASCLQAGNLAQDFDAGNILLKAVDTTKEIVA